VSAPDPSPALLPLPGGRRDARVKLHPLLSGEIRAPEGYLHKPPGPLSTIRGLSLHTRRSSWRWIPVPAFLVEHPSAGHILIDTGLHESIASDPGEQLGGLRRLFSFRFSAEQAVARQLLDRGVRPREISTVLMTHLHFDHASAVRDFPQATFVVDRREWAAAHRRGGSTRGYFPSQFDHPVAWRTVDFDSPEVEAFGPFGSALDLFGDGSVRLLSTPGHTPGHMSVLLRLRHREALLTIDAAYTMRTITEGAVPTLTEDSHRFGRSLGEVRRYVSQTPGALVVPGHDDRAWARLDPVYV
jgi:glyoxylase-like metal-dependent hydrolase (beta-lactamase superfamily II)